MDICWFESDYDVYVYIQNLLKKTFILMDLKNNPGNTLQKNILFLSKSEYYYLKNLHENTVFFLRIERSWVVILI